VCLFHRPCSSGDPPVGGSVEIGASPQPLSRVFYPVSVCLVRKATSATAPCVCGCRPAYSHRPGLACWKCVHRLCSCEHSWWSVSRVSCGQASLNWNEYLMSGRLCKVGHLCNSACLGGIPVKTRQRERLKVVCRGQERLCRARKHWKWVA